MTLQAERTPRTEQPTGRRTWLADLALGARLSLAGGRTAWLRTALTAVGVGFGVALLLLAASVPAALQASSDRLDARDWPRSAESLPPADDTMVVLRYHTEFRGTEIAGVVLQPDGSRPPVPPGLSEAPGPGEMVVSPALAKLLDSSDGELLAPRLPYERVGTIGPDGLAGPNELYLYIGAPAGVDLETVDGGWGSAVRINRFGAVEHGDAMPVILLVLAVVAVVVLLLPIGVFTAAAVRFGSEARDRQLAAVRLLGADIRMARWIAAGGALAGALFGCAVGAALFAAGRLFVERITLFETSVFAADLTPNPALAVVVLLAVPACAVAITLFSLRRVMIEPLGVVRRGTAVRRRLWWRLLLPAFGAVLLLPLGRDSVDGGPRGETQLAVGVLAVLVGVTVLLPWLVEAVVRRLGGGPVAWQLAVRRLQLDSAAAVRAVGTVAVAVAGAIALQMVFTVAEREYVELPAQDDGGTVFLAEFGLLAAGTTPGEAARVFAEMPGVRSVDSYRTGPLTSVDQIETAEGPHPVAGGLVIADCRMLRQTLEIDSCADGDTFVNVPPDGVAVRPGQGGPAALPGQTSVASAVPGPGLPVVVSSYTVDSHTGDGGYDQPDAPRWTIPDTAREVQARAGARLVGSVFATPAAVPAEVSSWLSLTSRVQVDPAAPDAAEHVRNAAARISPLADVFQTSQIIVDPTFGQLRTGIYVGTVIVLGLIGASLLVNIVEQLRERRRVLAVLVAFGTRRGTLAASVLWQTAIPLLLGVALAIVVGMGLGTILLRIVEVPVGFDWANIATVSATAVAVVLAVTAASLPALWRLMRPTGLRTE